MMTYKEVLKHIPDCDYKEYLNLFSFESFYGMEVDCMDQLECKKCQCFKNCSSIEDLRYNFMVMNGEV